MTVTTDGARPAPRTADSSSPATVTADSESEWLTLTTAARAAGVSERTLRRWIAAGAVESRVEETHGHPVRLVNRSSLATRAAAGDRDDGHAGESAARPNGRAYVRLAGHAVDPDTGHVAAVRDTHAALLAQLSGAQLAAKLQAARYNEERDRRREVETAAREDRQQLGEEIRFLREQLQQARDAEKELRLMLAATTRALEAQNQRPALQAQNITPLRRWWRWWAR